MKVKKGRLKQFIALLLTLSMFLAMGITAGAAVNAESEGTISISGLEEVSGMTVRSYKIIDVNFDVGSQQPEEPIYRWVGEVAEWLKEAGNPYGGYVNAANNGVTDTFANEKNIKAFVDALANAVKNQSINLSPSSSAAVSGTGASLTEKMGAYLILVESGMKIYAPGFAKIYPEYDAANQGWTLKGDTVSVAAKSQEASITKAVGKKTAAIGDTVTYTLTVRLPDYPDQAVNKDFRIGDKLPKGLKFNEDSVKFYSDKNTEIGSPATYFTKETNETMLRDNTFEYQVDTEKLLKNVSLTNQTIYVQYTAKVLETAYENAKDLKNTAYIRYQNDPYGTNSYKTVTSEAQIYTYGVRITKTGENDAAVSGAQFTLTKSGEKNPMTFSGRKGAYYVSAASGSSSTVEVDANGELLLAGLDVGAYTLTEVKAPGGYALPSDPNVSITLVDAAPDGTLDSGNGNSGASGTILKTGSAAVDGTNPYQLNLTVTNSKSNFTLPITGGTGTVLFTVIGLLLMALAAAMMTAALRKRRTNR